MPFNFGKEETIIKVAPKIKKDYDIDIKKLKDLMEKRKNNTTGLRLFIDWSAASCSPKITLKDIEDNPTKIGDENSFFWSYRMVSKNPNLTIDFVKKNPIKPWNWEYISANPGITMEDIKDNPKLRWDWNSVSKNPNLTIEMIKENPDKKWNWFWISRNKNITMKIIKENEDFPWDWEFINKSKL